MCADGFAGDVLPRAVIHSTVDKPKMPGTHYHCHARMLVDKRKVKRKMKKKKKRKEKRSKEKKREEEMKKKMKKKTEREEKTKDKMKNKKIMMWTDAEKGVHRRKVN